MKSWPTPLETRIQEIERVTARGPDAHVVLRLVVLNCCYLLLTCVPEPHAWSAKVVIFAQTTGIVRA
jgi:hypothetical protein